MNKTETMNALNYSVDSNLNLNGTGDYTCWQYWEHNYYPLVIKESYPVYIQEKAVDKGVKAFEVIKILKDKKLVNISKVSDFIELMDTLIKIL